MYAISPSQFQMLKKEVETMGELLSNEQLDRVAEVDKLRIQIEAFRRTLIGLIPNFAETYDRNYEEALRAFDPEHRDSSDRAA